MLILDRNFGQNTPNWARLNQRWPALGCMKHLNLNSFQSVCKIMMFLGNNKQFYEVCKKNIYWNWSISANGKKSPGRLVKSSPKASWSLILFNTWVKFVQYMLLNNSKHKTIQDIWKEMRISRINLWVALTLVPPLNVPKLKKKNEKVEIFKIFLKNLS